LNVGEFGLTSVKLKSVACQPIATPWLIPPAPLDEATVALLAVAVPLALPLDPAPPLPTMFPPPACVDDEVPTPPVLAEALTTLLGPGRSSSEQASASAATSGSESPNRPNFMRAV
jgi:hypothetical protein